MNRPAQLACLLSRQAPWDIAIIGGGDTGIGTAADTIRDLVHCHTMILG